MATILNSIPVEFNQEQHIYTNTDTGEQYKGITSTLINRLFPDKYAGIPADILAKAAEYGSNVHADIELCESLGVEPGTPEGKNYLRLKEENDLHYLASEHTVSDFEHYATNIDCIYEVEENVVDIADYKTTSKFDRESVSWQLSICAHFLEKNNPHIKVRRLLGIWLRGDIAQVVVVERRASEEIEALIAADIADAPFSFEPFFPEYISENEATLYMLGKQIKELTDEYEALKADVLAKMQEHGDKSFDTGNILITYIAPTSRESFDSKKFKEENAEMYKQYMKKSETKASLKLTIR